MVTVESFLKETGSYLSEVEDLFVTTWGPIHAFEWSPGHVHILDAYDDMTGEHFAFMVKYYDEQGNWSHDKCFDHFPENDADEIFAIYQSISEWFKDMKRYDVSKVVIDDLPF